jgi:hypothetical protein
MSFVQHGENVGLVEIEGSKHSGEDLTQPYGGLTWTDYMDDLTNIFMY